MARCTFGIHHDIGWITYSRMRNHLTAEAKGRYGYGFGKVAFYDLDSMKGSARPRTGDSHFTPTMLDSTKELRILRLP
jgi:hypothetical protein